MVRIHLIGDQRPQRGKPIHVFSPCPLAVSLLNIPGCHVIEAGIAQHIVQRVVRRYVLGTALHYHRQLSLIIQPAHKAGGVNVALMAVQGVRSLEKQCGAVRVVRGVQHGTHFLNVVIIIFPHAHQLGRLTRRQQAALLQRKTLPIIAQRLKGRPRQGTYHSLLEDTPNRLTIPQQLYVFHAISSTWLKIRFSSSCFPSPFSAEKGINFTSSVNSSVSRIRARLG